MSRKIVFLLLIALATPAIAMAQPGPDPSPFAAGDLKRPIFDTQTSVPNPTNQQEKSASTVVAEVDGRAITLGDVANAIAELPSSVSALPFNDLFPSILEQLVRQQALVIRAQQQALDEDPAIRRKAKAAADRVMANELLHQEISAKITEKALLERYDRDFANKPGPDEVHVRVMMLPTEDAAQAVIAELKTGADFAALAKKSSQDPTASVGGDLGYMRLESLNPEVGAVAFSLPPGQFTPFPFRSAGAWFILKVEDRRHRATPPFAEVRERLVQTMLREGVGDIVTKALAAVTIREYSINGKENVPERLQ
jgi:peptidyl-prolyl cis-trans isomerase C